MGEIVGEVAVSPAKRDWREGARRAWTAFGPFLGLLLIVGLFAWLTRDTGTFQTAYTWRTIARQTMIVGTASLGMTMIMIAGGIDLSVGSIVALVTVAIAMLAGPHEVPLGGTTLRFEVPLALALVGGIAIGGLCGLFNGALITGLGVVPFIVTLGSLKIFRGAAKWLSGSNTVSLPPSTKTWWMTRVLAIEPEPRWLLVSPGVWLLLGLSVLLAMALRSSLLGRYLYAVGSNEATARLCGVNVPGVKLAVYGLAGLATGLAGALQFLQMTVGDPTTGDGLELQVIAAVVIGGGSLAGGEGTVLGTLIGCLIISVLNAGCTHAGIPDAVQHVIIGAIIIAAVTLDRLRRRRD